jgi:hypothetical protein
MNGNYICVRVCIYISMYILYIYICVCVCIYSVYIYILSWFFFLGWALPWEKSSNYTKWQISSWPCSITRGYGKPIWFYWWDWKNLRFLIEKFWKEKKRCFIWESQRNCEFTCVAKKEIYWWSMDWFKGKLQETIPANVPFIQFIGNVNVLSP